MNAYLFICLGTRDVRIKCLDKLDEKIKNELNESKYPLDNKYFRELNVRKFGHWLGKNFDLIKDNIEIPLIEPFLIYIEGKKHDIKKIYLIATDQKDSIKDEAKEHLGRDTCILAEFLENNYLKYYFNSRNKEAPVIETIILNNPPNDYDLMIKEFGKFLQGTKIEESNDYVVYAEITGGTPQINTSVILNCTAYYRDKVTFLYKSENEREIKSLSVARYILDSYEHESLQRLAERYDFDAIAQNKDYSDTVRRLARCACYRMNFDFFNYKSEVSGQFNDIYGNPILEILRNDAFNLVQQIPEAILNELYWNTVVMWQRDECANFLGRVWRIMEVSLQYALLEVIKCDWDKINEFKEKFTIWANKNEDFKNYLKGKKKNYGLSEIKKPIVSNMPILHACIDFLAENDKEGKNSLRYNALSSCIKKLRALADMRNKSIIAHGFEGVSKDMIKDIIKKEIQDIKNNEDIFFIIRSLIESLGMNLSETNPFEEFKEIIVEVNRKKISGSLYV